MPLRIGVVGGGAAGLAVLKILSDTDEIKNGDWTVTAFEKRDNIGGIWYPSPPVGKPPATPLYDALTTNIPNITMAFRSFPLKPSTPLYPSAEVVLEYLRDYANYYNLRKFIRLLSSVEKCEWSEKDRVWTVSVRTLDSTSTMPSEVTTTIHNFDKLIIANGHYCTPRYPTVPGLLDWLHPSDPQTEPRVTHSVYFRNPTPFEGKCILVVGGGPSGIDIVSEVCTVASVVYHSTTEAVPSSATVGNCTLIKRGRVRAFHGDGTVSFDDAEADRFSIVLDHAILATGYEMDFPFIKTPILKKEIISFASTLPSSLFNTTYSIYPLTRHILPITEPDNANTGLPWHTDASSLAFLGLFIRVAPFPLFEAQALYLISLYRNSNNFSFPHEKRWIENRYNSLKETFGADPSVIAKKIHVFTEAVDQYTYATEILDLANISTDCQFYYPEPWNVEIYLAKDVLRRIWRMLEKEGKAEELVRGVGSAPGQVGRTEWLEFSRMLIREYGSKM